MGLLSNKIFHLTKYTCKDLARKLQGLAHEFLLNNEDVLAAFDHALKLNSKIGLKRKADTLRKKLAGS